MDKPSLINIESLLDQHPLESLEQALQKSSSRPIWLGSGSYTQSGQVFLSAGPLRELEEAARELRAWAAKVGHEDTPPLMAVEAALAESISRYAEAYVNHWVAKARGVGVSSYPVPPHPSDILELADDIAERWRALSNKSQPPARPEIAAS